MIKIYTSPSCSSCRKVKSWMKNQNINFDETNIFAKPLNEKEIKEILYKTENGTDDIVSKRSKIIKESNIDIEELTVKELISFIRDNPSVLKRPIIVDDRRVQVGYNEEEIRAFIPPECRDISSKCFKE